MLVENKIVKKVINVGMGETWVSPYLNEQLVACGLGSCIGLVMYDPKCKIAGMAHLVLPDSSIALQKNPQKDFLPGKFVDSGVDYLLENMVKLGAVKENIIVSIAGGSQMFNLGNNTNVLNIGLRNVIAVKAAIQKKNLKLHAQYTGGNKGRTMSVETATGIVSIRTIGD